MANTTKRPIAAVVGVGVGLGAALARRFAEAYDAIDMPFIRRLRPQLKEEDMLAPAAIADAYWHVAHQHPSAWTQELDVRPYKENF